MLEIAPTKTLNWLNTMDRWLDKSLALISILVLPLSLLLFLQWPLRDIVQAYSREANDLAQIMFALYVSAAITKTSRLDGHLCTGALARKISLRTRLQLKRMASLLALLPWSAYVFWAAWPGMQQSAMSLEAFPDTYNPGFFLVKLAVGMLVGLVLLQGFADVCRRIPDDIQ